MTSIYIFVRLFIHWASENKALLYTDNTSSMNEWMKFFLLCHAYNCAWTLSQNRESQSGQSALSTFSNMKCKKHVLYNTGKISASTS